MSDINPSFDTVLDQWDPQWEMDFSFDPQLPLQWIFEGNEDNNQYYPELIDATNENLLTETVQQFCNPSGESADNNQYYPDITSETHPTEMVQQLCNPEELRVNNKCKDLDEKCENLDKKYQELRKDLNAQSELDGQRRTKLKELFSQHTMRAIQSRSLDADLSERMADLEIKYSELLGKMTDLEERVNGIDK